jgi:hypothetical protein
VYVEPLASGIWYRACKTHSAARSQRSALSLFQNFLRPESNYADIRDDPRRIRRQHISSIINLVCPQCGGSMMEFQCNGKCRRNWLAVWESALRDGVQ